MLCGLLAIVGSIYDNHILSISKPRVRPEDYFYFKIHSSTLNCQAVINSRRVFFFNLFQVCRVPLMILKSFVDLLYINQQLRVCFLIPPYVETVFHFTYSAIPCYLWLLVPHYNQNTTILESLFNMKLCRGRGMVENAFGILEETWQFVLTKTELNVIYNLVL